MKPTSSYKRYGSITLFLMILTLYSCGKDDAEDKQPAPTKQELIQKEWNLVSVVYDGQPMMGETFMIRFLTDGTFNFNTPGVPDLPQSGNWALNTGGTLITLNGNTELRVTTLTQTRFVFEYDYTNHKMGSVNVRFTLD